MNNLKLPDLSQYISNGPRQFEREYIEVTPSDEPVSPDTVIEYMEGLRSIGEGAFLTNPPYFEFLVVKYPRGKVRFFYASNPKSYMDKLKQYLQEAHPSSFNFERTKQEICYQGLDTARIYGYEDRKGDVLTPIRLFSGLEQYSTAPLNPLIESMAESPTNETSVYQVIFQRKEGLEKKAKRLKDSLLGGRRFSNPVLNTLHSIVSGGGSRYQSEPSSNNDDVGPQHPVESAGARKSMLKRADLVDKKDPRTNYRAIVRVGSTHGKTFEKMKNSFRHLSGTHLQLVPVETDETGIMDDIAIEAAVPNRFMRRVPIPYFSPDEISNLVTVPSIAQMKREASRITKKEVEAYGGISAEDALYPYMVAEKGMRIGTVSNLGELEGEAEIRLPPTVLKRHWLRSGVTGAGKTTAVINDMLSIHEELEGPTILIDRKGGDMCENYKKSHAVKELEKQKQLYSKMVNNLYLNGEVDQETKQLILDETNNDEEIVTKINEFEKLIHKFKNIDDDIDAQDILNRKEKTFEEIQELLKEKVRDKNPLREVRHIRVPDDGVPAIPFFDIRPDLANGVAWDVAVQDRADRFHEMLKMILGGTLHEQAYVSREVITSAIKTQFDPVYGTDAFGIEQLYSSIEGMLEGNMPDSSDEILTRGLNRHFAQDERQATVTINAALSRIMKINERKFMWETMDYVPEWDKAKQEYKDDQPLLNMQSLLKSDDVILIDIGELKTESEVIFTMLVLSQLQKGVTMMAPDHKPEDYVINLILEEAAPFMKTELMGDELIPMSREFDLSIGLIMQYPEQVKEDSPQSRVYREVLNNVNTKIIGRIPINDQLARSLFHENLSEDEVQQKIKALPEGKWMLQLPPPSHGANVPQLVTLKPLPLPKGHVDSGYEVEGFEQWDKEVREQVVNDYCLSVDLETLDKHKASVEQLVETTKQLVRANEQPPTVEDISKTTGRPVSEIKSLATKTNEVEKHGDTLLPIDKTGTGADLEITEGSEEHKQMLLEASRQLARQGFIIKIVEQGAGEEKPDAEATKNGETFNIEVEKGTLSRPGRVYKNFNRANKQDRRIIVVVESVEDAEKVNNIINSNETYSGKRMLTYTENNETYTVVKEPETRTRWETENNQYVLKESSTGDTVVVVDEIGEKPVQAPAVYRETEDGLILETLNGDELDRFSDVEELLEVWRGVTKPMTLNKPVPNYKILVSGKGLYEDGNFKSMDTMHEQELTKDDYLEMFIDEKVIEDEDEVIPKPKMYNEYKQWCKDKDVESFSKNWFGRKLNNYVEFEEDRDSEERRYKGITLKD